MIDSKLKGKVLNDLNRKKVQKIYELENNDYSNLTFLTTANSFCDFSRYRKALILFSDIGNGKAKQITNAEVDNIKLFFDAQEKVLKFYGDYSTWMNETRNCLTQGRSIKVKVSNTSEDGLIEIRQIVYPSYREKEISKKL